MEKLKKSIPYLLIVLFVGWFSYKFFVERKTIPQDQKMALDWDQLDATSGTPPAETPATLKKAEAPKTKEQNVREHSTLTKSEQDKFAAYDEVENKWLAEVQNIMGDEFYPQYLEMRERNEKEKMQAYKEYHDFLRKKHGDNFSYNISEDQSIREKKINQIYLKELLQLVGEKKFKAYIEARDKINENNRRNGREFIQVEF